MKNFDDEQIPDDKSMSNLAESYAKLKPVYASRVIAQQNGNSVDMTIWQLYKRLGYTLQNLVNCYPRAEYRQYFSELITQNENELERLLVLYPNLNGENIENPIFHTRRSCACVDIIRRYFLLELRLLRELFVLYNAETDETKRQELQNFLNRHYQNFVALVERSGFN